MRTPENTHSGISERGNRLLRQHAISTLSSVKEGLAAINALSGAAMTLFAVTPEGLLAGTVTDGDIRRAIISGIGLDDTLEKVMHKDFLAANPDDDLCLTIAEGRRRRLSLLPVVESGHIVDIIDLQSVKTFLPIDAVLMAGGRGERLRPLTLTTPKPLLEVGGKPIIDYNIEELESCGVKNIFVTVNYLAEQIIEHFDKRKGNAIVECILEPKRLGTIGSLALIDSFTSEDVLLMNSDLLTGIDFEAFYLKHKRSHADVTMAAVPYTVSVPFAILHLEGERVIGLEEKPTYNYFANAGVYLIKRDLLKRIVKGEFLDAPDFVENIISDGGKVECFPVQGTWIDIGSPDDYRHANEMMSHSLLKK
ncbi:MAG: nucleotidyltransferase family protein [Muribaculaceae bacterium]|nr:nucleotidyltransferase family protein [Muribaculaceae bacterium]MDE6754400.1 nucleotidyltransferase family protein [Muribaculaceae bacterium]